MAGNKNSGRKAVDNPLRLRTRRLTIMLSPAEFNAWTQAAGNDPISDFVRQKVNSTLELQGTMTKEMPK